MRLQHYRDCVRKVNVQLAFPCTGIAAALLLAAYLRSIKDKQGHFRDVQQSDWTFDHLLWQCRNTKLLLLNAMDILRQGSLDTCHIIVVFAKSSCFCYIMFFCWENKVACLFPLLTVCVIFFMKLCQPLLHVSIVDNCHNHICRHFYWD